MVTKLTSAFKHGAWHLSSLFSDVLLQKTPLQAPQQSEVARKLPPLDLT